MLMCKSVHIRYEHGFIIKRNRMQTRCEGSNVFIASSTTFMVGKWKG